MSYPVLFGQTKEFHEARRTQKPYPRSVPHALVDGHEVQAKRNHSQTLERLAQRGGLSPMELWCVVHDQYFYDAKRGDWSMTEAKAIEWLRTIEGVEWLIP